MRYTPAPRGPPGSLSRNGRDEIIRETTRTLESKLGWSSSLTAHLEKELRGHFSEAWISGCEALIPRMTNDEKDRHVAAAAVHGEAAIILTLNLRHFRPEHLATWGVRAPPSILSDRNPPPGASSGVGETRAAGSRSRPQLEPASGHSERHRARLCCGHFRRNLKITERFIVG